MLRLENIRVSAQQPTRLALGRLGTAEGFDEDVIDFFDSRDYEVTVSRKRLGSALCTYAEISPPITREHLEDFNEFLHEAAKGSLDIEAFVSADKITLCTY
jgi:hypothetical protein